MSGVHAAVGVEVWRGGVNAWECDDMGHLNTRFYVVRCMEGLRGLLRRFQLTSAGGRTPRIKEMHIRFHREAQLSASLHMDAGFARFDASEAEAVLVLRHSATDMIAATFRVVLALTDLQDSGLPFADRVPVIATPAEALPRGIDSDYLPGTDPDLSQHLRIAMGNLDISECDANGRMLPQKFIGSVSDGIRRLTSPLREIVVEHAQDKPERYGGAVLEFRILHLDWPKAGDCFEIRSAFRRADAKTMSLEHWMVDPISGATWGYMESIAIVFDLERRKIVGISPAAQAALQPLLVAA